MKLKKTKLVQQTNRTVLLLIIAFFFYFTAEAQITIGSGIAPHEEALLDLKETNNGTSDKGLLMPRVSLSATSSASPMTSHVEGMTVYNTSTIADVIPGYYYNDGNKWTRLAISGESQGHGFFYMPSIVLPTDTGDPAYYDSATETFTVDLYGAYASQFGMTASNVVSNSSASTTTVYVVANTALDYFITYYDNAVFSNVNVTVTGVLTYKLISGHTITENTFMNIVFKEK